MGSRFVDTLDDALWLTREHWLQMQEHVQRSLPEEACGLVAGRDGLSLAVYPVDNILHSPVRFHMDPVQQVRILSHLDDNELELLAIYHSHPQGPAHPSETDIAEAYYPEAAHLIWSLVGSQWTCDAFRIRNGQVVKIALSFL
jgi:[CysO sulfur-carrier protein]-S-L-cysteine hydrolase